MMLVTLTWEPPSCAARLPQKFSAATTVITDEPPEPVAEPDEVEQPARTSASAVGSAAAHRRTRCRAAPGGRVESTADLRQQGQRSAPTLTKTNSVIKCSKPHGTH